MNLMVLTCFTVFFFVFGCNAKQTTLCEDPKSADCPTATIGPDGALRREIKISSISPLVAKPGQQVTVKGLNLSQDLELRVGDQSVVWAAIAGDAGTFVMPSMARAGAFLVSAESKNIGAITVAPAAKFMIADSDDNLYPIYMASPADICAPTVFRDADGILQMGTKACGGVTINDCNGDGQIGCLANVNYPSADTTQIAANLKTGVTVGGVSGTLTLPSPAHVLASAPTYGDPGNPLAGTAIEESHASCTSDGQLNCVTNAGFKAADMTVVNPGSIKSGVSIAGVLGDYPSATYRLPGSSGTDLTGSSFFSQITSSGAFQYYDSTGVRYTNTGDSDIVASNILNGVDIFGTSGSVTLPNAWDLRIGVTVGGVTGKLKVNCRNRMKSTIYNYDGSLMSMPLGVVTSGTSLDYWDTIDDYNNGAPGLPPQIVSNWSNYDCSGIESATDDEKVWKDVTTDASLLPSNCATTASRCTMKDKITGLHWSKMQSSSATLISALNICDTIDFNGATDWRLPTQKELMEFHIHGMRSAASTNWLTEADLASYFWSSTAISGNPANVWKVGLGDGNVDLDARNATNKVICVRP